MSNIGTAKKVAMLRRGGIANVPGFEQAVIVSFNGQQLHTEPYTGDYHKASTDAELWAKGHGFSEVTWGSGPESPLPVQT